MKASIVKDELLVEKDKEDPNKTEKARAYQDLLLTFIPKQKH